MARILITGSSEGLGSLTARALVKKGHQVVLHARNATRATDATSACPGAESVVTGDLSTVSEVKKLAEDINALGRFDVVIHNAGLYTGGFRRTKDGYPSSFAVNTLAPYILTGLLDRPKKLIYISSGYHLGGDPTLQDITWTKRGEEPWEDVKAYSDTKLQVVMLAFAIARKWPEVKSNSIDPGWVPTRMGGPSAINDLNASVDIYTRLAEGDGELDTVSGKHFLATAGAEGPAHPSANDIEAQERLLAELEEITGVKLP